MEGFNLFDRKNFDKMECQTHESLLPIDVKESVIAPNEKFNKVIFWNDLFFSQIMCEKNEKIRCKKY